MKKISFWKLLLAAAVLVAISAAITYFHRGYQGFDQFANYSWEVLKEICFFLGILLFAGMFSLLHDLFAAVIMAIVGVSLSLYFGHLNPLYDGWTIVGAAFASFMIGLLSSDIIKLLWNFLQKKDVRERQPATL